MTCDASSAGRAPGGGLSAIMLSALLSAPGASAALVTDWVNGSGGLFDAPASWSMGVPGAMDTARFNLEATYVVQLQGSESVGRLLVRRGAVGLDLSGEVLAAMGANVLLPSLVVGEAAGEPASLSLLDDGLLTAIHASVGSQTGSSGLLSVLEGTGLAVEQVLLVGANGHGEVMVADGAVTCGTLRMGTSPGSVGVATISGAGGRLTSSLVSDGATIVGQQGEALLSILGGATMTAGDTTIGLQSSGVGAIIVGGAGTTLDIVGPAGGSLDVGDKGTASLAVLDGGVVTCGGDAIVGLEPTFGVPGNPHPGFGDASILGGGSLLSIGGDLWVPYFGVATLTVGEGGRVVVGGSFRSTLAALSRGWPGSTLRMRLSALDRFGPPLLDVADIATLSQYTVQDGGIFKVELADGFLPANGDVFTLIAAAGLDDEMPLPALPDRPGVRWITEWTVEPDHAELRLTAVVSSPADLDGDGVVNGADLGILLAAWGAFGPGDLTGDGSVDGADLGVLLASWTP